MYVELPPGNCSRGYTHVAYSLDDEKRKLAKSDWNLQSRKKYLPMDLKKPFVSNKNRLWYLSLFLCQSELAWHCCFQSCKRRNQVREVSSILKEFISKSVLSEAIKALAKLLCFYVKRDGISRLQECLVDWLFWQLFKKNFYFCLWEAQILRNGQAYWVS